jgi:glycosyltransferase involved in cell wall biosynthesis
MARRIKILYLNTYTAISGAEIAMLELIAHLDRYQIDPLVICPRQGQFTDLCIRNGIQVKVLPGLPQHGSRARETYRSLVPIALQIASLIRQENVALVHSNSPRAGYFGGLGARLAGVPSVIHVRDTNQTPFASASKSQLLDGLANRFIVVSDATRKTITAKRPRLEQKIAVVYDGIAAMPEISVDELTKVKHGLGLDGCGPICVVIGTITALKGQKIAIQAMARLKEQFPESRLLIVGATVTLADVAYREELLKEIQLGGLEDQIIFTGFRDDIAAILASSDILIHPSILPDAFPHVLLEASMSGTAMIGSAIGGIPEIIVDGETGCLVPPGNAQALASAITALWMDPAWRARMSERSIEKSRSDFSMQTYAKKIHAIYQELLKNA